MGPAAFTLRMILSLATLAVYSVAEYDTVDCPPTIAVKLKESKYVVSGQVTSVKDASNLPSGATQAKLIQIDVQCIYKGEAIPGNIQVIGYGKCFSPFSLSDYLCVSLIAGVYIIKNENMSLAWSLPLF